MVHPAIGAWFEKRGISATTLTRWPVDGGTLRFGDREKTCVVFNYLRNGERVNWKARPLEGKDFRQQKGAKARFWNLDRVLQGPQDVVYITEGEADALSLSEAGIPEHAILSVPNGAPSTEQQDLRGSQKFAFALEAITEGLAAQKYVLAVDNDDPGRYLRQGLATVLGKAKCWYVDWPSDLKDANDALKAWGGEQLRRYVTEEARPWPISGLYTLEQLPEPSVTEVWNPGFLEWENKVRIAPRMISVMTGRPGHGKSHFAHQLWHQIAKAYQIRCAVFSAETPPLPYLRRYHRQFFAGKREVDMDDEEHVFADEWIREHIVFMQHPQHRPTFAWIMDTIEAAAQRYGCRAALIDPWNKLEAEHDARRQSETQWIGECLDLLIEAAKALQIHIMIVAHPAKPEHPTRKEAPDLYSISGSANWFNRVDQGFTMWRPEVVGNDGQRKTNAVLYHRKARFEELGYPCKLNLELDLTTGNYRSTDYREW